jgi:hypothetical protein
MMQIMAVMGVAAQEPDSTYVYPGRDSVALSIMLQGGYHYSGHSLVMVGVGRLTKQRVSAAHSTSTVLAASVGFVFRNRVAVVPTVSAWMGVGLSLGIDLSYVIDGHQSGLVLRPAFGFGLFGTRMKYGVNIKAPSVEAVGTHVLMIEFPLYKHEL